MKRLSHATLRHTHSILRFTLHERRFTRTSGESAIAIEAFTNHMGSVDPYRTETYNPAGIAANLHKY